MSYIMRMLDEHYISIGEYSDLVGLDVSHVRRLLKGNNKPIRRTLRLLSQGLERIDGKNWRQHAKIISEELEIINE